MPLCQVKYSLELVHARHRTTGNDHWRQSRPCLYQHPIDMQGHQVLQKCSLLVTLPLAHHSTESSLFKNNLSYFLLPSSPINNKCLALSSHPYSTLVDHLIAGPLSGISSKVTLFPISYSCGKNLQFAINDPFRVFWFKGYFKSPFKFSPFPVFHTSPIFSATWKYSGKRRFIFNPSTPYFWPLLNHKQLNSTRAFLSSPAPLQA